MSTSAGPGRLRDDLRATRVGRLTATIAGSVCAATALLVLFAAEGASWASVGLWACFVVAVVTWTVASFEMVRHQRRTDLSQEDRDAWQRRMWPVGARGIAFLGGILVPWFYLLGGPAQRRLARYERRPSRHRS